MKSKQKKHGGLSYSVIGIIFGAFLAMIVVVILVSLNQKPGNAPKLELPISHDTPRPTAVTTPTIDPHKQGFHGYDESKPWFDLALPPECSIGKNEKVFFGAPKIITCPTKDFTLIINPQEMGRDVDGQITERKSVTVNGITWERISIDNDTNDTTTYTLNTNANTYLLRVTYEPFTTDAQHYFETILSSFHFID
jgi:hypothetical protein